MNRIDRTSDLFVNGGLNCAQAILTVYGQAVGLGPEKARMLGRPLGGGVGGSGHICGFLTGAVQVLAHAFDDPDEKQAREETHRRVIELLRRFRQRNGALTCNGLLGVDKATREGRRRIKEDCLVQKHCPYFGRDVAEILESLLRMKGSRLAPVPDGPAVPSTEPVSLPATAGTRRRQASGCHQADVARAPGCGRPS